MNIFFFDGTITPNSFKYCFKLVHFFIQFSYLVTDTISVDPVSKVAVWVILHVEMAGYGPPWLNFLGCWPDGGSQPLKSHPGLVTKLEQRRLWCVISEPDKCIKSINSTSTYHHVKYRRWDDISIVSAHIVAVFRNSIQYPVSWSSGLNVRNSFWCSCWCNS